MKTVLGVSDTTHHSEIAVIRGGEVLFSAATERISRRKGQGGMSPELLELTLDRAGIAQEEIDVVCFAGYFTPLILFRICRRLQSQESLASFFSAETDGLPRVLKDFLVYRAGLGVLRPDDLLARCFRPLVAASCRRSLPRNLRHLPLRLVEHHECHARGAVAFSTGPKVLCITADGLGDGTSVTVSVCEGERLERLWHLGWQWSPGLLFAAGTGSLGFRAFSDEGKVMALAAYGTPEVVEVRLKSAKVVLSHREGFYQWKQFWHWMKRLREDLCVEDLAAFAQNSIENAMRSCVTRWVRTTGIPNIVFSGGLFANVKMTLQICRNTKVESAFVFPNMGDSGLAVGAALSEFHLRCGRPLANVYWGSDVWTGAEETDLESIDGLKPSVPPDLYYQAAHALAEGYPVGVVFGRFENGPRALGHRSILCRADSAEVLRWLGERLDRPELMPFAPCMLDSDHHEYLEYPKSLESNLPFMTVCVNATEKMKSLFAPVVFVDGTVRPQVISESVSPELSHILSWYKKLTGQCVLVNTSFNRHGDPIVGNARDAIISMRKIGLRYICLGNVFLEIEDYVRIPSPLKALNPSSTPQTEGRGFENRSPLQ